MRFGPVAVGDAVGAVLAHATMAGDKRLKKGHRLSAEDIATLKSEGVGEVIAAVLDEGDVDEDAAAQQLATALNIKGAERRAPATGRVNLHAAHAGVFTVDRALVDAINRIDPAITLATLPDYAPVAAGQMIATVKIIPFAVAGEVLGAALAIANDRPAFEVHQFSPQRIGVVQTVLPSLKPSVMDKTLRVTEARLARSGSSVGDELRVGHRSDEVSRAIGRLLPDSDIVVVFGASAMSDRGDVIPAAIEQAGGRVVRVGMPVDPGNLIIVGEIGGKPVLGAPGCARSPKDNGFDWVLDRLIAGIDVTDGDIAGMGVGGLLMEIPTRPQPRETPARPPRVHTIVLAAGKSSRMGGPNKLLSTFDSEPLVRRVAGRVLASQSRSATVVTGHQGVAVVKALDGLNVAIADNPAYADGLSTSLKAGIAAVPANADAAMVVLGDMPEVTTDDLNRLIREFGRAGGQAIIRASSGGKRGNPVILPRAAFAELALAEGDSGARALMENGRHEVVDVDIGPGAMVDVDTPEALKEAGGLIVG